MAADRLGVGVVGLGVGEQHARAFAALPECRLRAVVDHDHTRAASLAEALGADAWDSFDALCAAPEIDIVAIASYDDDHFGQVLGALEAGKHVFVEKPLCRSLAEVGAVEHARRRAGTRLESNLVLRAAPFYRWLRDQTRAGALGRAYAFDGDYLYGRLHKLTEGWRGKVDDYSVLLGGGVHLVDLMLWITGERPSSVTAVGNRISTEGTAFRYDDFAAATFSFPSGLVGRITANFGSVHPHQHSVRMFGTEGSVIYDDQGPRLFTSRDPGDAPERLDLAALPATKGALIAGFVEAILGGADTEEPARHELDVICACIAAERAIAEGGPVDIEYA